MNRTEPLKPKTNDVKTIDRSYLESARLEDLHLEDERTMGRLPTAKITQGQLEAVALRFRGELEHSLHRARTSATAAISENVLIIEIAHSLSVAEHNLIRRTSGRSFFQHYVEKLAEQMHPTFVAHIEDILPVSVTYSCVRVEGDNDSITFSFGIRTHVCWTKTMTDASLTRDYA